MQLKTLTSYLRGRYKEFLQPAESRIMLPHQIDLFEIMPGKPVQLDLFSSSENNRQSYAKKVNANTLAYFYECMTRSFYGGLLCNSLYLPDNNGHSSEGCLSEENEFFKHDNGKLIKPDLLNSKDRTVIEVKASLSGRSRKLNDEQVEGYALFQKTHPEYRIWYNFYRHGVQGIRKEYPWGEDRLRSELAKTTYHSLLLPLSVIIALHQRRFERPEEVAVYDPGGNHFGVQKRAAGVDLRSPVLNLFHRAPRVMLARIGLDPHNYIRECFMSPQDFYLTRYSENQKIEPFPILRISDRDHPAWVEDFLTNLNHHARYYPSLNDYSDNGKPQISQSSSSNSPEADTLLPENTPF